jgi:acetyl esterase
MHPALLRIEATLIRRLLSLPPAALALGLGQRPSSPEGYLLDAQTALVLRLAEWTGQGPLGGGPVARARHQFEQSAPLLAPRVPDVETRRLTVAGATGPLAARLYRPRLAKPPRGPLPLIVFFHGGGFVLGSLDSHDGPCRQLAQLTEALVVSVDYRLAPEHPYPAAVEDARAAYRDLARRAEEFGADPRRLAVAGDSAGGNLAAVTAWSCRAEARPPRAQLLVYPVTDFTRSHASHRHFSEGFMLTRSSIDWFRDQYAPDSTHYREPTLSPLFVDRLDGAAPAVVLIGGFDPLRDEGIAYAERLRAAGTPVELLVGEGMVHGFFSMAGAITEAHWLNRRACELLRVRLALEA